MNRLQESERISLNGMELIEQGLDRQKGNLLGVQPSMAAADYASEEAFHARLKRYMDAARDAGWLNPRTIVVWPEYFGTWLVSADEPAAVARARTMQAAMQRLAVHHPWGFIRGILATRERERATASLLRFKSVRMAAIYQSVFSQLAKGYGITVVAGSILLPGARVHNRVLQAGDGPIQNVLAVYRPDGRAEEQLVRKVIPTEAEQPFVSAAPVEQLPVFETPAGKLGVLICADSWYTAPYERMKAQGAELIAVPSYIDERGLWDAPWKGYNGGAPPADVDARDVGSLSEGEAWHKHALAGRLSASGARYGINVFLRGSLWDMGMDGRSLMVQDGSPRGEAGDGPALLNLWL